MSKSWPSFKYRILMQYIFKHNSSNNNTKFNSSYTNSFYINNSNNFSN